MIFLEYVGSRASLSADKLKKSCKINILQDFLYLAHKYKTPIHNHKKRFPISMKTGNLS